jgi:GntR family transcriptional regulator/MocR family aminotransferase
MHLVAYTRKGISDTAMERSAREAGVIVRATSRMHVKASPRSGLMLGFCGSAADDRDRRRPAGKGCRLTAN